MAIFYTTGKKKNRMTDHSKPVIKMYVNVGDTEGARNLWGNKDKKEKEVPKED